MFQFVISAFTPSLAGFPSVAYEDFIIAFDLPVLSLLNWGRLRYL
jgi:hypothetical protein